MDIITDVINYLEKHNIVYTKTLYKALKVKATYNISQNEFRNLLYNMQEVGTIQTTTYNGFSAWRLI